MEHKNEVNTTNTALREIEGEKEEKNWILNGNEERNKIWENVTNTKNRKEDGTYRNRKRWIKRTVYIP